VLNLSDFADEVAKANRLFGNDGFDKQKFLRKLKVRSPPGITMTLQLRNLPMTKRADR
jgi:hypothetical protein